jgi:hypothetical protein
MTVSGRNGKIILADGIRQKPCIAIRRDLMTARQPRYSAEETARRGDEIYERNIRAQVETTHRRKVVAIDIDSGTYVIADNALTASERLLAQHPNAELWCVRVGSRVHHRMGGRPLRGQT